MAFRKFTDIPRKNLAEVKKQGYSFLSDYSMVIDGWYILALRWHLTQEGKARGEPEDWNWYKELSLIGSDNMGTWKTRSEYPFQWPNAPWTTPPVKLATPQSITFFNLVFETPGDMIQFRLKYL